MLGVELDEVPTELDDEELVLELDTDEVDAVLEELDDRVNVVVPVVTVVTVEVNTEVDDVEDVEEPVLWGTVEEMAVLELETTTQPYGPHV